MQIFIERFSKALDTPLIRNYVTIEYCKSTKNDVAQIEYKFTIFE